MKKDKVMAVTAVILALVATGCSVTREKTAVPAETAPSAKEAAIADGGDTGAGSTSLPASDQTACVPEEAAEAETTEPSSDETPAPVPTATPKETPVTAPASTAAPAFTAAPAPTSKTTAGPSSAPTAYPAAVQTASPRPAERPTARPAPTPEAAGVQDGNIWAWVQNGSGMIRIDKPHSAYDGIYVSSPEAAVDPEGKFSWGILKDRNETDSAYECTLFAVSFRQEVRKEMEKVLRRAYPTAFGEVMDIIVLSMRQELWETRHKDTGSCRVSGTFGTRYLDDREVWVAVTENCGALYVMIYDKGHIDPETPDLFTREEADARSAQGVGRSDSDYAKWFRKVNGL